MMHWNWFSRRHWIRAKPRTRVSIYASPAKETVTNSEAILRGNAFRTDRAWPLHSVRTAQELESYAGSCLPPYTLMERAGLAVAQFTLALAPHAKTIWIPCGPGNNGGDGFVAARILKKWGKRRSDAFMRHPASTARCTSSISLGRES